MSLVNATSLTETEFTAALHVSRIRVLEEGNEELVGGEIYDLENKLKLVDEEINECGEEIREGLLL